jgi:hypothetical protein
MDRWMGWDHQDRSSPYSMKAAGLEHSWILAEECQEHLIHGDSLRFVATRYAIGGFPFLDRDLAGQGSCMGQISCFGG